MTPDFEEEEITGVKDVLAEFDERLPTRRVGKLPSSPPLAAIIPPDDDEFLVDPAAMLKKAPKGTGTARHPILNLADADLDRLAELVRNEK